MKKSLQNLYKEWGRLDAILPAAPKSVKKTISARKARVGKLILRAERRSK
jgi:hypothetical protein